VNKRIKNLRKVLNLTQQEFADRLNIKRNTVATYEAGKSNPSDAAVVLICREFHVSETWLRTGEGEMFQQRTRDDELAAFMDELLAEESSDFRRRLVTALSRLSPQQWDALEAVALNLLEEAPDNAAAKPDAAGQEEADFEAQARAKADLYYQQLLSEQEQARQAPSAKESGTA
jgi:transcriptional regulator with XRE-family HTH domain